MGCVSTGNSALLINGETLVFFNPSRGLRKHSPLSPLLFVLVVEKLSRVSMEEKRRGSLQGIEIDYVLLTHLLFVYDILLF
jgi:hypothetical protein